MGTTSSQQVYSYPQYKWQRIQIDNKQLYRAFSSQSRQQLIAQKHIISFKYIKGNQPIDMLEKRLQDSQQQLKLYKYRQQLNPNIAKIYQIKNDQQAQKIPICQLLNPNPKPIRLVIFQQYIVYRLNQIRNLNNLQGIYVLEQSLNGFYTLFKQFGFFVVDQYLVGFNCKGKIKLWINSNFSLNAMSSKKSYRSSNGIKHQEQYQMVGKIWFMVQKYSLFDRNLVIELNSLYKCTFKQSLLKINQYKNKLFLTNYSTKFLYSLKFKQKEIQPQFYHNNLGMEYGLLPNKCKILQKHRNRAKIFL